ncbi:MAG: methylenetetrahydrofolate reductase [Bdellovibrionales bacterium]|jgi:methylenetetrahydrofolate reductase (NADPH)
MSERFIPSDISFSLEVYPPKTAQGVDHLLQTVDAYAATKPAAITLTFGAAGGVDEDMNVRAVIARLRQHTDVPVVAHVTCAGRSRAEVDAIVEERVADGVSHFVALRGDMFGHGAPYTPHPDGYAMTYDFVAALKRNHPDRLVYVAGYPETHPESPSESFDLDHLKHKVDAGADAVLTQFFFDPEVFLRWRDKVEKRGIHVPLIPGLLPILDFPHTCAMAQRCNASIPAFLHTMFDAVAAGSLDHDLLAMNVLSHQITRLVEHGVTHFHFYTMNETRLTRHLCAWLRAGF